MRRDQNQYALFQVIQTLGLNLNSATSLFFRLFVLFAILWLLPLQVIAADVSFKVYWPQNAGENSITIQTTGGTVVAGPFSSGGASPFTTTFGPITLNDDQNYVVQMNDSFGNGWNFATTTGAPINPVVIVTSDGVDVGNGTLASGSSSSFTFNAASYNEAPTGSQSCTAYTGSWNGSGNVWSASTTGGVNATITLGAASGASWSGTTNDNLNTINTFSEASVQNHTSFSTVFYWDNSTISGTDAASVDAANGTVTFNFSSPIQNPVIHFDRFGGTAGIVGFDAIANSSEWTLTTSGASITRLAGAPHFRTVENKIFRDLTSALTSSSTFESTLDPATGTAGGTIMVAGTHSQLDFTLTGVGVEGSGADGLEIVLCGSVSAVATDYGDAPVSYGDASAIVDSNIHLGATAPDSESDSQNDYRALLDGTEEDGAPQSQWGVNLFPVLIDTDSSYATPITVKNLSGGAATLEGWIDFDRNDIFDADEKTTLAVPNNTNGTVSLSWPSVPSDITRGTTFIRLRLTNDVTGAGEVEDHVISIALAFPPESPFVKVISGETIRSCQAVVFEDDFDDLTSGTYLAPNRPGFSTIRDWTTTGGGSDTYAVVESKDGGNAIYLGNGMIRRISPSMMSLGGLSFDSYGRLTSVIDAIELRAGADDTTPGVTTASKPSSWGPDEVVFSRTFPSTVGKTYRLYFTGIPEGEGGGGYVDGMMRIDTPVGSAHFLAPGSNNGRVNYAIEFTATSTSSTIAIANYGHIGPSSSGWCNPQHADLNSAAWCTLEGTTDSTSTNEVTIDDIYMVEAGCDSDFSDAPADGSLSPDGAGITAYGEVSHDLVSSVRLGATVDLDSSTIASAAANGDGSDDDGVVTFPSLIQGGSATIPVAVNQLAANDGYLQGWIDWNGDGDFLDSGEQIATDLQYSGGTSGTINVAVTVPASAITSQTFARFRWSTASGLNSRNSASDGEVEDYALTIMSPAIDMCTAVPAGLRFVSDAEADVANGLLPIATGDSTRTYTNVGGTGIDIKLTIYTTSTAQEPGVSFMYQD